MTRLLTLFALTLALATPQRANAERRSLTMAKRLAAQASWLADGQSIVLDRAGALDLRAMTRAAPPLRTANFRALSRGQLAAQTGTANLRALSALERSSRSLAATIRHYNGGRAPAMKAGETLTICRTGETLTIVTNRLTGRTTRRSFLLEPDAKPAHVSSAVHYRTGHSRMFKLNPSALGQAMMTPRPVAPFRLEGVALEHTPILGIGQLPVRLGSSL